MDKVWPLKIDDRSQLISRIIAAEAICNAYACIGGAFRG